VLAGISYPTRLWVLMELFTFIRMGGTKERIYLAMLSEEIDVKLTSISAAKAQCTKPGDADRLLGIIESGFGDLRPFDRVVHEMFGQVLKSRRAVAVGAPSAASWMPNLFRAAPRASPSMRRKWPRTRLRRRSDDATAWTACKQLRMGDQGRRTGNWWVGGLVWFVCAHSTGSVDLVGQDPRAAQRPGPTRAIGHALCGDVSVGMVSRASPKTPLHIASSTSGSAR